MGSGESNKVSFTVSTWVTIISMITSGVAANLLLIWKMSDSLQARMDHMDERWQRRSEQVVTKIEANIKEVRDKIPPEWFRQMVEDNEAKIDRLESEVTRDFIRKDELRLLIEQFNRSQKS